MRVAVIGCGLIGAATARELALRGADTVVFEAHVPGRGTSGTTFAWVNSYDKQPRAYHDLNVAAIAAHADLEIRNARGRQGFFQTGNIVWPADADRIARLESWGYQIRRLTTGEVHDLEPDLRPSDAADYVFLPEEGFALPAVLLGRLLGEALDLGAELRCPATVERVEPDAGGVRLWPAGGEAERVDAVAVCAGRWSGGLLADAGQVLPMIDTETRGSAALGFLAYTRPAPVRLARVVTTPGLNVRPDGGGRLVLQALDLDATADPSVPVAVDGPIGRDFTERLAALLRGGEHAKLDAIAVGQRALPADGLSVVGPVGDSGRVYAVVSHSGVTLAPLLGRLAATELITGEPQGLLAPFRPGRLSCV